MFKLHISILQKRTGEEVGTYLVDKKFTNYKIQPWPALLMLILFTWGGITGPLGRIHIFLHYVVYHNGVKNPTITFIPTIMFINFSENFTSCRLFAALLLLKNGKTSHHVVYLRVTFIR